MKNQIKYETVLELADDIMLELSESEIQVILATDKSLKEKFEKVTSINAQNVEPLFYPFENAHTFLREDEEINTVKQADVLANAPSTDGEYITIVKVVK
jgi:aspartyl-tRNA(Asn)/glutamyl-tRNA(Gln) amidotransferase subunit C